jgi:Protein of unknown function (DUF3047)
LKIVRLVYSAPAVALVFCALSVAAADRQIVGDFSNGANAKGVPQGWELKEKSGRANLALVKQEGIHAVQLRSADTSFSLQRQIQVNVQQYPVLTWKWKVDKLPAGGDFRRTKTDDQAAQLFVAFSRTQAIVYIWDSSAPEGLMADAPSPPFISIKAVVVRSGPSKTGQWITEERNVYEDYRTLFGASTKSPVASGLRLQINTQHTRSSGESYFAEVMFQTTSTARRAAGESFLNSSTSLAQR